jgi:hypothetical protein
MRSAVPTGALEVYDQDDVLHIPGFGFDGYRGLSPLRHHLRMSGAVALATQEYAARFFANNARPDIVLTTDQKLTPELAAEVADLWAAKHSGPRQCAQASGARPRGQGRALSLNAEDAQLLATRQFQIEEIARIYGVPPFMIGHTEKTTSWGSGVETMGKGFVRFTLRQHLNKFQNEINRKFFRNSGKFIEFDTFELEQADMETLFTSYGVAIGGAGRPGFMTAGRDPQPAQPDARSEARHAAQRRRCAAARRAGRSARQEEGQSRMNRKLLALLARNAKKGEFRAEGNVIYLYDIIVAADADAEWFGGVSAESFVQTLRGMSGDVELRINSPGGDVFGAKAMAQAVRDYPGQVTAHVDGIAASAATFLTASPTRP